MWSSQQRTLYFVAGIIVYLIATIFWAYTLTLETLSKAIIVVTLIGLIGSVLVGVFYFHETLTFTQKIGLVLAFIAIILIEM